MKKNKFLFGLLLILFCSCVKFKKADVVIHNAKIYTVNENFEIAQAMAIKNGKIIAIGKEHEIMNKFRADEFFDAQTQPIYPGFIDAHAHLLGYGLNQLSVDIGSIQTQTELIDKLKTYQKANPKFNWLVGYGWGDAFLNGNINNNQLNANFPNTPVLLWRKDGHGLLVNKKAISIATNDSIIIPNGLVPDEYINQFIEAISYTKSQKKQAIRLAQEACLKNGITSVTDAGITNDEWKLYKQFNNNSQLDVRVYAMLKPTTKNLVDMQQGIDTNDFLTVRALKLVADGSLGAKSACLLEPYESSTSYGKLLLSKDELLKYAQEAYEAGFQLNVHCIGDSSFRVVTDVMGTVLKFQNDKRWRIEHAQIINKADINKLGKYSILPSVQPTHGISDINFAQKRLGAKRLKDSYKIKSLIKENGIIAFGTDFPVEGMNPIQTFYDATVRTVSNKDVSYLSTEKTDRETTLKAMTFWNAMAQFQLDAIGSLEVGKKADFVILNRDIITVPAENIMEAEVQHTFVNGYKMYSK